MLLIYEKFWLNIRQIRVILEDVFRNTQIKCYSVSGSRKGHLKSERRPSPLWFCIICIHHALRYQATDDAHEKNSASRKVFYRITWDHPSYWWVSCLFFCFLCCIFCTLLCLFVFFLFNHSVVILFSIFVFECPSGIFAPLLYSFSSKRSSYVKCHCL